MRLDYEKYRHHLQKYDLDKDHEEEIMDFIWHLMSSEIDQAFGMGEFHKTGGQLDVQPIQSHTSTLQ